MGSDTLPTWERHQNPLFFLSLGDPEDHEYAPLKGSLRLVRFSMFIHNVGIQSPESTDRLAEKFD